MTARSSPSPADVIALVEWARREAGGDDALALHVLARFALAAGMGCSAGFLRRPPAPDGG